MSWTYMPLLVSFLRRPRTIHLGMVPFSMDRYTIAYMNILYKSSDDGQVGHIMGVSRVIQLIPRVSFCCLPLQG